MDLESIRNKFDLNIEKFISFLFGEKNESDPEQRIYNKLLRLEGEELENWVNEKLKPYIIFAGYCCDFEGDEFEGILGATLFSTWYLWPSQWNLETSIGLISFDEIFDTTYPNYETELQEIIDDIHNFQQPYVRSYRQISDISEYSECKINIMTDYMVMYIMTKNTDELKNYIIQLVDPFEMK